MNRKALLLGGLTTATAVVWGYLAVTAQVPPANPPQQAPSRAVQPVSPLLAYPPPPAPSAPPAAAPVRLLLPPPEGRAFVLDAWARPAEGGRYHASELIKRCAGYAQATDLMQQAQPDPEAVEPEHLQRVAQAHDRILRQCGQFTEDDLLQYSRSAANRLQDKDKADPVLEASRRFIAATSKEDRDKATAEVLQVADPVLVDGLGTRLIVYRDAEGSFVYFDGKRAPVMENPAALIATYLLPCNLGLECGSNDTDLLLRCMSGEECYADRRGRALAELAGGDVEKYAQAVDIAAQMAAAIRAGQWSKFIWSKP